MKIVLVLVALFMLSLGGGLVVWVERGVSSDWLADRLSQEMGRTVHILGPTKVDFWKGPRLTIRDLQIENPPKSPFARLAELESVSFSVAWWGLPGILLGQPQHSLQIEVLGGLIQVDAREDVLGADGVWPSADDPFTGLTLWLEQIEVKSVRVEVETEAGGLDATSLHYALFFFQTGNGGSVMIGAKSMDVEMEGIDVQGQLQLDAPLVEFDAPKPANLSGILNVRELNLVALGEKRFGSRGLRLSDVKVPVHFCQSWDVDLSLKAESIDLKTGPAEAARLRMSSSKGRWKIELLEIRLPVGLGRGTAQVSCDQLPADLSLEATVTAEGHGDPNLPDTSIDMSGEMKARFQVAGRGENWQQIVSDLHGDFSVFLGPVQSNRLYDDVYSRGLYHALTISWGQSNRAIIDCGVLDVGVHQGVGRIRQILVATPDLVIGGHGEIDLKNGTLDVVLKPESKHLGLTSLHIPVLIHGAIRDPHVGPAWASLLPGLGKQAIESLFVGLADEGFWEGLKPTRKAACLRAARISPH
ncbi:MAG: hypothetical protein CBC48_10060 [bacterium TMED88]|nr:hypothetical protein [Deltaproteobacteria bacterium]OUV30921.1 MAG: hypothetical protein CBC48_10060 [bacterium TMED88]